MTESIKIYRCPKCGAKTTFGGLYRYCPNCGILDPQDVAIEELV